MDVGGWVMKNLNVCTLIFSILWIGFTVCPVLADDGASELAEYALSANSVAQNDILEDGNSPAAKDSFKDAIHITANDDANTSNDDAVVAIKDSVAIDEASPSNDDATSESVEATSESVETTSDAMASAFSPKPSYRLYAEHHPMTAMIETSKGTLCCDLFIDDHPMTVLNFKALADGKPAWTDKSGNIHRTPYYDDLPFAQRERGAYVVSGVRQEGTDFYVKDERCTQHHPVAGSLVMVQPHPNAASTRFMILARDIQEFYGMYTVFGQCTDTALIQSLSSEAAMIQHISIKDKTSCEK